MQIEYTHQFKKTFNEIIGCGQKYYSIKTIQSLYGSLKKAKDNLQKNPFMGQKEPLLYGFEEEYRYILVGKHLKIIYTVISNRLYFVDLWDTRQSPRDLIDRLL